MFKDESDFEKIASRLNIDAKPNSAHRENLRRQMLSAFNETAKQSIPQVTLFQTIKRTIMKRPITKIAVAVVILIAVVLSITFLDKSVPSAYAIEQTIEVLKNVRFLHLVRRGDIEQVKYKSWTEFGSDGKQIRYRQDSPPDFLVVEDGKTVAAYHKDKNTVVLYDPKDKQYTMGAVSTFLENITEQGIIIDENVEYQGRYVHRVRWLMANQDCFVDPETKLPIAACGYEMSYEEPPEGTFEIVIPDDFAIIDKRPGAEPTDEPDWFKEYQVADENLHKAMRRLHKGEFENAVALFKHIVQNQPRNNWAWVWLGKAHYELGEYDLAIYEFSKVIDMLGSQPYCHYARGLAYAQKSMQDAANEDLAKALPWMILALRYTEAATFFEWADGPYYNATEQQILARMIDRLRIITGQNFGYDPNEVADNNEQTITAWEEWYENSGQIEFAPDAKLVPVPATLEQAGK